MYCSDSGTEEAIVILDGPHSKSKGSPASRGPQKHPKRRRDRKKFISYVTMLGNNVACEAPKNGLDDQMQQQEKGQFLEQTDSRNSGPGQS